MLVEELWRPADEAAKVQLERASRDRDLTLALLAIEGAPPPQQEEALDTLDALARRARAHLPDPADASPEQQLRALRLALASYQGDREDYHAPENSHLGRVLQRRRGLPILLSALWILVGERLGAQVQGVGLPGHFIARVGGDEGLLVDPFSGGARLDREACKRHVERALQGKATFHDGYLRAVSHTELLERVIRNLIHSYQLRRSPAELYRCARLWAALRPDQQEPRDELRRIEEALGLRRPRAAAN